jgi:hypothetical protein
MNQNKLKKLAIKYYIEDIPESSIPGSFLANLINRIEVAPDFIPEVTKNCLRKKQLRSLLKYACKQISLKEFSEAAIAEQSKRKLEAEQIKKKQIKQAAINAEKNKKRKIINKILKKYDLSISFINHGDIKKLKYIIEKADHGSRLNQDEIAWLMITRKGHHAGYYTQKLREKYHSNEAEFYSLKFIRTKNPWDIINASSHFRKCNQSRKANLILIKINADKFKSKKIKSAFNTTFGGVKRDLKNLDEALSLGSEAHLLTPKDFRPCTLLGAVNIEIGNYDEGQSWYKKAIERGATEKSVDDDLRSIFMRLDKSNRKDLAIFLYENDPERYSWVKKYIQ